MATSVAKKSEPMHCKYCPNGHCYQTLGRIGSIFYIIHVCNRCGAWSSDLQIDSFR